MIVNTSAHFANRLIDGLPPIERNALLAYCEPFVLTRDQILSEPHRPLHYAYFPLSGFIAEETVLHGHPPLAVAMIGCEGMLGATLVLGTSSAPTRVVVQGEGQALRLTSGQLRGALLTSRSLKRALQRYLFVLLAQLPRHAACSHFHEIEQRLACWLLMAHDRVRSDQFHLTHESLADMLGVHRSGITIAAGALQREHLIRYARGEIHILDRPGLEAASCSCYDALIEDSARFFPTRALAPGCDSAQTGD
jgi:CRP-like cAMP-binding protein